MPDYSVKDFFSCLYQNPVESSLLFVGGIFLTGLAKKLAKNWFEKESSLENKKYSE